MYKIYFENRFLALSDQPDRLQKYCLFYKFHDVRELYDQITSFLNNENIPCANFYSYKIDYLWKAFTSYFNYLEAAGGVVKHNSGKLLVIKRHGRWDIPKGHMEKDETPLETAVREISEECGINAGDDISELSPTFHMYRYKDKFFLKKTHWFFIRYSGSLETSPQGSEGITEAEWVPAAMIKDHMAGTWASVADVVNEVSLKLFE